MKRYSTVARTLLGAIGITTLLSMSACGYLAAEPNQAGTYAESPRSQEAVAEEAGREGVLTTADAAESYIASTVSPQPTASPPLAAGGTNIPNDQPYDLMYFASEGVNPFVDTEDDHFSTFAMDVDTASYTVVRRYLNEGHLPPEEAIRVEEFINYFDLNYPGPENDKDAFAIHLEGAPAPFGPTNAYLLKVGLQGKEVAVEDRKPANLVFVIDISGSMAQENRLGLVKRSLQLLVDELRPTDTVGIVVYGSTARALLTPTSPEDRDYILAAIDQLEPDGSTNAEEGLRLGYEMAANAFQLGGINRVILLSDGVANVGNTGPDSILQTIDRYVDEGITLSTVGFGMGNYNDILMEQLANDGNGNYAYVDTLEEARRIFVENLTGTLQVIAKDAKVQVDFNPEVVRSYRLLGYENRDVADQDFRNDEVDAGEVGAGHSVTALYEIKLHDSVQASEEALALTTYIRYQDLDQGEIVEVAEPFNVGDFRASLDETSDGFRLIAAVAEYAEILRGSYWAKEGDLGEVERLALSAEDSFAEDSEVLEFFNLLEQAGQLVEPDPQP
ncbi:MAG TPA: VWA domain-containing protein [Anaerolineae bacterium]|nr:VWA domain-containing protein [Anaerolineae bacterium]HMR63546.1 VWA domain-containing protein [Anaerolineae bacterium]